MPSQNSPDSFASLNPADCTPAPVLTEAARALCMQFLAGEPGVSRYLLGRNEHAARMAGAIAVEGIVDDYFDGDSWNGIKVVRAAHLPADAIVVNCSMSISPVSAARRLSQLPIKGWVNYSDLAALRPDLIGQPAFVTEMRNDLAAHKDAWESLRGSLADLESVATFHDLVRFRATGDPRYMQDYAVRFSDQYFEPFMNLGEEVFVDAGGYNGDTTEEFCKRYPDYKKVYLFEPVAANLDAARQRLGRQRDILFSQLGLSGAPGLVGFDPEQGSASGVSDASSFKIEVTTLDAAVSEKVSFIKMDLEGWELQALQGCRRHILEEHPKLAISVYHAAADFWKIPQYVLGLRGDYRVYLRHYTEGWSETVMYFLPINDQEKI